MKKAVLLSFSILSTLICVAQFSGPSGSPGTEAMHKDSSDFVDWAVGCFLERGYLDISNPGLGLTDFGNAINVTGPSDGQVASLGDSGIAVIIFVSPIFNGPGNDFAVFENSFSSTFLELAFVEVSSDGINYFRFPATSNTPTNAQIGPFDSVGDATLLNNLAGKHMANYGTPFDLEELVGTPGLNLQNITHVKIIDVVGSISSAFGSQDQFGTFINDPFPTAFTSGGFDIESVGVINQQPLGFSSLSEQLTVLIYPNPARLGQLITIESDIKFEFGAIYSLEGKQLHFWTSDSYSTDELVSGVYLVQLNGETSSISRKLIVH
ncbi:MAG: hypothetical protein ACI865_002114 [Flavobacteriaceae bacterium]|jgi:hypothetical protein